jgi:hypothetical protein
MNILLYILLKISALKSIAGFAQQKPKEKLTVIIGKLHSDEANSLLVQMYAPENENLFI